MLLSLQERKWKARSCWIPKSESRTLQVYQSGSTRVPLVLLRGLLWILGSGSSRPLFGQVHTLAGMEAGWFSKKRRWRQWIHSRFSSWFLAWGEVGGGEGPWVRSWSGNGCQPGTPSAYLKQVSVLGDGQIRHLKSQGVPRSLTYAEVTALRRAERAGS